MPRSILTEKLSRRGYHLTREYGTDPLEIVIVRDLMSATLPHNPPVEKGILPSIFVYMDSTCRSAAELMATEGIGSLPVMDRATQQISGTITLQDLLKGRRKAAAREHERLRLIRRFNNGHRDASAEG